MPGARFAAALRRRTFPGAPSGAAGLYALRSNGLDVSGRRGPAIVMAFLALVVPFVPQQAAAETIAIINARVLPVSEPAIEHGTILIQNGKISAVGDREAVLLPDDADVIDASGKTIIPGIVDTHSHIGGVSGADSSHPIQPGTRVADSVDVLDSDFRRALAGGITTVNLLPGSSHLISGQTLYVKLRDGRQIEDIAYLRPDGTMDGGLKVANGTNSMGPAPFPGTRSKSASLLRSEFIAARTYSKDDKSGGEIPEKKLGLDALADALRGERIVHFHSNRYDDILTALRLRDEFGLKVVLHHTAEAHLIIPELAASGAPVSLILLDSPGGKLEAIYAKHDNAPLLEAAGVEVAFHSDDNVTDSRLLLRMAAFGVRAGMTRSGALRALTFSPARMLGLDDRIGSIEPGKDADLVILSGDPFSVRTRVLETWVEGVRRFDLDAPDDRNVAEGGFRALH